MDNQTLTVMTWLIPAGPLLAFFLIALFTNRNKTLSWVLAWAGIIASLIMGWIIAIDVFSVGYEGLKKEPLRIASSIEWLPFFRTADKWLSMGVAVDPLTAVMLIMVPFAVFMIYVYSVGYHNYGQPQGTHLGEPNHGKQEPLFSRFFAFMALFGGAMLILTVADNLLLLFVGWEIMGLCSYLLIGFWYARTYEPDPKNAQKLAPRYASIKAFMTTRVADVIMMLGIVWFYRTFGTLNFSEAFSPEAMAAARDAVGLGLTGLGGMALLIFAGTVGKSAQWPLHAWLPNAMEGPTPVSAVIHAAAMVSAGVYLILRIFPLISAGIEGDMTVSLVIGGIGAFTALMAATIAVAQDDVKGVLAYSTISQLGFMVAAVGIGAYIAAAFHLITHAFFKALLFLASGSVIHGMEHGAEHVHDHHTDPQDMMNMGGLRKKMPITFWTFVIGGAALSGFPFITAGFWSKDEIFAEAWHMATHGNSFAGVVFVMLALAALLTAFYTTRQIVLTFLGKPRTPLAEHAHESNGYMTVPLMLLSVFAIGAGWFGIPKYFLGTEGIFTNYFHDIIGGTLYTTLHELHELGIVAHEIETLEWAWMPLWTSLVVALGGIAIGLWVYARNPLRANQPDPLVRALGPLHGFLRNKWYWDELYQTIFIRPVVFFSEVVVYEIIDRGAIDGTLHLVARSFYTVGEWFRKTEIAIWDDGLDAVKDGVLWLARELRTIQAGKVQEYALLSVLIIFTLTALILLISTDMFAGLLGVIF